MDAIVPKVAEPSAKAVELNAKGAQFFRDGHMEPARLHFLAALLLEPNQPQVLQNMGAVLRNLNYHEAAESMARRSVVASGDNAFCRSNLGVAQLSLKKYHEALITLKSVTKDMPDSGPSWHNYGLALYMIGRYEEALAVLDKSIELAFAIPQVRSDRALTLLSLGRIQEGLEAYECRWDMLAKSPIWDLDIPEWQGEPLFHRQILVHHEQGFGDSLMLVRFVKLLLDQKAQVTLAVPESLIKLFARSFPAITVVDMKEPITGVFDYHSPLLSVMRHIGINTPKDIDASPYLIGEPMKCTTPLPDARLRIGICWASGNHSEALRERRRIVPITQFLPLSEIPDVSLVSLQVGKESGDICANGMEGIIFDLSHKLEDFSLTADLIARLDLVISVDSAVAHLAGAMGKPCVLLSPYTRCWRWWSKNNGWPWYERMTTFHQSQSGHWTEAVRNVTKTTKEYMERD